MKQTIAKHNFHAIHNNSNAPSIMKKYVKNILRPWFIMALSYFVELHNTFFQCIANYFHRGAS